VGVPDASSRWAAAASTSSVGGGQQDLQPSRVGLVGEGETGGSSDVVARVGAAGSTEDLDPNQEAAADARNGGDPVPVGDEGERCVDGLVRR